MDIDPVCLTDLERAYAFAFNLIWMVNFFFSPRKVSLLLRGQMIPIDYSIILARKKLADLLLTSAEKLIMTAIAES